MAEVDRIVELEMRQAFQDDTIQALNDVIAAQGEAIVRLQMQVSELIRRYEEVVGQYGAGEEGEEAPPPHY
ncbi:MULTISPECIES: SlyX family protein [Pseudomonas]|uniref:SlyX family protein n=1 Tax=Pseudomonas TaxID=286 RepID=UPI0018AC55D6|nr:MULTISPECIES: SlyX family protein [Pseudomonas]MBF8746445.1 SlyX family protein [Pseudomonas monteilii]MCT8163502.1 SlyX family protein [Pseudomonas sp. HD6422]MCT8182502.1 SlyX family protein [Pseudomonas sp. HD6421]